MAIAKTYWRELLLLFFGMIICGALSVSFGKELSWDLAGYHFYNPYAYLNHRLNIDYWPPSAIQHYIVPTLDFLTYYLIKHVSSGQVEFILGAIHGMNVVLLFMIVKLVLQQLSWQKKYLNLIAFVTVLLGMYSPTIYPMLGSFSNDNTVSIFILVFILLFLRFLTHYVVTADLNKWQILFAFLFLGASLGFKLTTCIYVLAAIFSLLCLQIPIKDKCKIIGWGVLGIVIGLLLTSGYWMLLMWHHFQNPFFPFLNSLFHSSYFIHETLREPRYLPKTFLHAILFPYYLAEKLPTAESYFIDYRFAICYFLIMVYSTAKLCRYQQFRLPENKIISWFLFFSVFTFIFWETIFSIMRYLLVLQMLAPLMIIVLIFSLSYSPLLRAVAILSCFTCVTITMRPIGVERTAYGKSYFNVSLPQEILTIKKALIIMPYAAFARQLTPYPHQYLIPFFPKAWQFVGIPYTFPNFEMPPKVKAILTQHPENRFVLISSQFKWQLLTTLKSYGLALNPRCQKIMSDRTKMHNDELQFCAITPLH